MEIFHFRVKFPTWLPNGEYAQLALQFVPSAHSAFPIKTSVKCIVTTFPFPPFQLSRPVTSLL